MWMIVVGISLAKPIAARLVEDIDHLVDNSPPKLKKRMRAAMVRRIDGMGLPNCAEASERICRHLVEMPEIQSARTALLFACDLTEPDLLPLVGKDKPWRAAFPRIVGNGILKFFLVDDPSNQLVEGKYGLREPDSELCACVEPEDIDLVMAPGRAFDEACGARLGRGGGFYDRLLGGLSPQVPVIGVCFRCQLVDQVPIAEHDIPVQKIVTEAGVITI